MGVVMLAETVSGKIDTADIFFLVAMILALLAAILYAMGTRPVVVHEGHAHRTNVSIWAPVAGWLAVASAALAWWVL
jgi:hypothetical protein